MATPERKGLSTAYAVLAVLVGIMMCFSAFMKFSQNPDTVKVIHGVVGVPLGLFPVFGALLAAGGIGLVVGIFRPKVGLAAAAGLCLYFLGAIIAHLVVGDVAGLKAPIVPFLLAVTVLTLRVLSLRRAT
jgi:hypothetical protein